MPFHKHVLEVHAYLHGIEDDRAATMTALIHPGTHHNKNELIAMWKAVEKRSDTQDNLWVYVFLENVVRANSFPSFFYISQSERNALIKKIENSTRQLISIHKQNKLDVNIIHSEGVIYNGFHVYEDFGESNKWRIDNANTNKVEYTQILEGIAQRSIDEIKLANVKGKSGKNVKAIRFVRSLAKDNTSSFGQPLNNVIATSVKAIFKLNYSPSDIRNLLAR